MPNSTPQCRNQKPDKKASLRISPTQNSDCICLDELSVRKQLTFSGKYLKSLLPYMIFSEFDRLQAVSAELFNEVFRSKYVPKKRFLVPFRVEYVPFRGSSESVSFTRGGK